MKHKRLFVERQISNSKAEETLVYTDKHTYTPTRATLHRITDLTYYPKYHARAIVSKIGITVIISR